MVDNLLWCFTFPPTQRTVSFETKSPSFLEKIKNKGHVCGLKLPWISFTESVQTFNLTSTIFGKFVRLFAYNQSAQGTRTTRKTARFGARVAIYGLATNESSNATSACYTFQPT